MPARIPRTSHCKPAPFRDIGPRNVLFASVSLLSETAAVARKGYDITYCALFYAGFVLVYLPFCFISPPSHEVPLVGKAAGSKPVVDDLDEV